MKSNNFEKLIYPNQLDQVCYLEANKNNTILHFVTGKTINSGYNLKQFEKILEEESDFKRIHRSYIININHINEINEDLYFLKMSNDEVLPITETSYFAEKAN
jgi:DNA-binding LytR/AlgR family response regulator